MIDVLSQTSQKLVFYYAYACDTLFSAKLNVCRIINGLNPGVSEYVILYGRPSEGGSEKKVDVRKRFSKSMMSSVGNISLTVDCCIVVSVQ